MAFFRLMQFNTFLLASLSNNLQSEFPKYAPWTIFMSFILWSLFYPRHKTMMAIIQTNHNDIFQFFDSNFFLHMAMNLTINNEYHHVYIILNCLICHAITFRLKRPHKIQWFNFNWKWNMTCNHIYKTF